MGKFSRMSHWKLLQFLLGFLAGYYACNLLPTAPTHTQIVRPHPHTIAPPSHNSIPIFVGIMTASKYISSRGCSAWRSWAKDLVSLGAEVRFFIGKTDKKQLGSVNQCGLPLVSLQEVEDDAYPPQRKSFAMFKWMGHHFGDRAYWFMRTDDDVYVYGAKLLSFLAGLDRRRAQFVGQAGRGRGVELGKLALDWNENFCMGGTGMVLSRDTLTQFLPKIDTCLGNLQTSHEDVEIGRCVTLATGKTCTWAYEMSILFYHSKGGDEDPRGTEVDPQKINQRILSNAITIHPVKSPQNMEALALRIKSKQRAGLLSTAQDLEFKMHKFGPAAQSLGAVTSDFDNLDDLPHLDLGEEGNSAWDLVLNHNVYSSGAGGARRKIPGHLYQGILQVVGYILDKVNVDARERGRTIEFRDLYYVYVKEDPVYGLTYILDLLLVYKRFKGSKVTMKVRRHVYVRQPALPPLIKPFSGEESPTQAVPALVPGDPGSYTDAEDPRKPVTVLVTVAGSEKVSAFTRFMDTYENEILLKLQAARLIIVTFKQDTKDVEMLNAVRERVGQLENSYPGFSLQVVEKRGKFSRAIGLTEGIKASELGSLLFIVDVDIDVTSEAVDHVRRFAVEGRSVYFPIVFSEFRDGGGYWRDFGYGIMAGYRQDIEKAGGYNTRIQGWGKEDVDLYEKFLKSDVKIFRTTDPSLVHKYHKVTCSKSLAADQTAMCSSSKANTFLPLDTLYSLVHNSSLLQP